MEDQRKRNYTRQEIMCPNPKCNIQFEITLEESDDIVILTKLEAQALYHQLKAEWLDRDFYEVLKSAMKKLDV